MKFENYVLAGIILLAALFAVLEFMHIIMVKNGRTKRRRVSLTLGNGE